MADSQHSEEMNTLHETSMPHSGEPDAAPTSGSTIIRTPDQRLLCLTHVFSTCLFSAVF
jgi:hypothetical protein